MTIMHEQFIVSRKILPATERAAAKKAGKEAEKISATFKQRMKPDNGPVTEEQGTLRDAVLEDLQKTPMMGLLLAC